MDELQHALQEIHARNARVEADKAWEVSWTRRLTIAAITYLTVVIFLMLIGNPLPFVHALVPVAGFLLSTLSLPWVKRWWLHNR